ncbi:MAG: PAS domain S-box protein [Bdellovibrionales bacterium]|nr:PAS domain S-box protein [Ramlibacter sp.]
MTTTETMLRAAIALAREAIFIIDIERLEYIEFNDATCQLCGRTREEMRRLGPLGIWAETGGSEQSLRHHYQKLIAQTPAPVRHRMALHRPDGSFVEIWMKRQALQIDRRWVIVACAQPASDLEKAKLPQTLESLRAQMEASTDAVSLVDYQAMRYIDINKRACAVLGYSRDELLEGDLILSGSRTLEDLRELYASLIMHSSEEQIESCVYMRPDGTEVPGKVSRRAVLVDGAWIIYTSISGSPRN